MHGFQPHSGVIRSLSKPELHMADGGVWGAIKSAVGMKRDNPEMEAYKARSAAEREAAKNPPQAPAQAGSGIGGYAGNGALEQRMKTAGLRDGGTLTTGKGGQVPGQGKGDKIPAKYEPGEFVVSNAMLKDNPGLADILHELREKSLAAQGKTVEEADEGAVQDAGIRAADGLAPEDQRRQAAMSQIPTDGYQAPVGGEKVSGSDLSRNVGNSLMALPGASSAVGAVGGMARSLPRVGAAIESIGATTGGAASSVAPYAAPIASLAAVSAASSKDSPAAPLGNAAKAALPVSATPTATASTPAQATIPATDAPPSGVTRVGNSYSGPANIAGDITVNGKAPGGSVTTQPGMSQQQIDATLNNPNGTRWSAQDNATMAENQRAGLDPYLGTSRGGQGGAVVIGEGDGYGVLSKEHIAKRQMDDMLASTNKQSRTMRGQTLGFLSQQTQNATAQRGQDMSAATSTAHDASATDSANKDRSQRGAIAGLHSQLEDRKLKLSEKSGGFQNRAAQRLEDAQTAVLAAKTPEERATANHVVQALSGKEPPNKYMVVPGGQEADPTTGQLRTVPARVFDSQAGRLLDQQPAAQAPTQHSIAKLKANPAMAKQFDEMFGAGAAAAALK